MTVAVVATGAVCGLLLLCALPKPALQIAVGIGVIGAAVLPVRARSAFISPPPGRTVRLGRTQSACGKSRMRGPPRRAKLELTMRRVRRAQS
jgi:hypothetical protein